MTKEELISLAKSLMEETLFANTYYDVLTHYRGKKPKYNNEILISHAFYNTVEMALTEALAIRLSRLYDLNEKSAGLSYLMTMAEKHIQYFPQNKEAQIPGPDGKKETVSFPLTHTLRECEECYFKEKVEKEKTLRNLFSYPEGQYSPEITIDVTIEELFKMYRKRLNSLSLKRDHLITQRNKIYAHNDKETNFNIDTVYKKNPLSFEDVSALLEFASDYTVFCYEYLSGNHAVLHFNNIDDLENTLVYVEKGMAYQRSEWKEKFGEDFDPFPGS